MSLLKYPAAAEISTYCHTLSRHDALPIWGMPVVLAGSRSGPPADQSGEPHGHHRSRCRELREHRHQQRHRPRRLLGSLVRPVRSEEHTSELQSLMRISYAVFCLTKNINTSTYFRI